MTSVVIVVPGIMGSELRLNGELIWPGSLMSLKLPYNRMSELMRPDLVPTDLIRSFAFVEQYSNLIDDLGTCGFDETGTTRTLYVFPYDWRKSVELAASGLADLADGIQREHGPGVEISIIAHSMGGLVSRCYLESGDYRARSSLSCVKRLITLATPHRGAPLALTAALGMEKRLFLSKSQVLQIASDTRYPALYQLLPPQGEPFAWDELAASQFGPMDVYDSSVAHALGLIPQNLAAAANLHHKLDPGKRPAGVRYFFFYGSRQTTIANVYLYKTGTTYRARKVELEDAGDGTVPVWSGQVTGIQGMPVGGEHGTIYRNADLRRTLATVLGCEGMLGAGPIPVDVSVRDKVIEPKTLLYVTLLFPDGVSSVDATLRLERHIVDDKGTVTGTMTLPNPYSVRYSGGTTDKIGLVLQAPELTGFYRAVFHDRDAKQDLGADDFVVQELTSIVETGAAPGY